MESGIIAVGSQQLAELVDGAGSPTNEEEKKEREINKEQKNSFM
jgi:hypothetical protein